MVVYLASENEIVHRFLIPDSLRPILAHLDSAGHRALIVGGAMRDALLGIEHTDLDIEVYGVAYHRLAKALASYGRTDLVGKSFGVVKLTLPNGAMWDFSVPRRDNKIGLGHRDFESSFDPSITPKEAASRRDFSINAMAYDPITEELLDFFGGREDLDRRILRATSAAFSEDPLRVLRGMQFACRFNLTLDPETAELCRSIVDQYGTIATERVAEEFMKWAEKATYPGRISGYLFDTGWIVHFPEIERLRGVPQDPEWHPEGDVEVHTMLVLDAAARVAEREGLKGEERAVLMFAALSHDFAKAETTELRERNGRMRWSAWGHDEAGGPVSRRFLSRIGIKPAIIDRVEKLVTDHMSHTSIKDVTPRVVRRLARRLHPATIADLVRLIEADASGRPPLPVGLPQTAARIREVAEAEAVHAGPQSPLILGRHVLPYFDGEAGKHIGEVTRAAYDAQMDGAFSNEQEALTWLEHRMRVSNRASRPGNG